MGDSSFHFRWPAIVLGAIGLLGVGAGISYVVMHRTALPAAPGAAMPAASMAGDPLPMPRPGEPLPDVVLTLADDEVHGAGIEVRAVAMGSVSARVSVAGTVESNTSQQTVVSSPAAGRLTSVSAEAGARVERGQTLAELSSPDLNEAQAHLLSAETALKARQEQLDRIEKLSGVGAVSRQDLDRARADQVAAQTDLDGARAHLTLLGLSAEAIAALITKGEVASLTKITAPAAGTILQIDAAAGQNVDPAMRLFTIADLSTVWVGADLPERDLARVHMGSPAAITVAGSPDSLSGSVVFLDPMVNSATHTSRVRAEVANPRGDLHPGLSAVLELGDTGAIPAILVPKEAVETVGDRQVVYLANVGGSGRFIEREVRLGAASGDQLIVLSGLSAGEQIAAKGSTFLRSEVERLGLRRSSAGLSGPP